MDVAKNNQLVQGYDWTRQADNWWSPLLIIVSGTTLTNCAASFSMGLEHRRKLVFNWQVTACWLLSTVFIWLLLLSGPWQMGC
jgi:hypothetical protein